MKIFNSKIILLLITFIVSNMAYGQGTLINFRITSSAVGVDTFNFSSGKSVPVSQYSFRFDPYNTYTSACNIKTGNYFLESDTAIIVLSSKGQLLRSFSKPYDVEGMEYNPIDNQIYCTVKIDGAFTFATINPSSGSITTIRPLSLKILYSSCLDYERGLYYIISDTRGLLKIDIKNGKKTDSIAYFATQNCMANEIDLMTGKLYTIRLNGTKKIIQSLDPATRAISTLDTLDKYGSGYFNFTSSAFNQLTGDWLILLGKNIGIKNIRKNTSMDTLTIPYNKIKRIEFQNKLCYLPIKVRQLSVVQPLCFNSTDGLISLKPDIHLTTLMISHNGSIGDTITQFKNCARGTHYFSIRDANNFCSMDTSILLNSPDKLTSTIEKKGIRCSGESDGSIIVHSKGGNKPYTYIFNQQSTGDSFILNQQPGNYAIQIIDKNNCKDSLTSIKLESPESIKASITNLKHPACFGDSSGRFIISAQGGIQPYSYALYAGKWHTDSFFKNLSAGNYSYQIRDNNDCAITNIITLDNPEKHTVQAEQLTTGCDTNSFTRIFLKTNSAYNLTDIRYIFDGDTLSGTDTTHRIKSGLYFIQSISQKGCIAYDTISVDKPVPLTITPIRDTILCKGQTMAIKLLPPTAANIKVTGTNGYFNNLSQQKLSLAGTYFIAITSANGCQWHDTFVLKKSNLEITHDFLMPSESFAGDTVVLINMSNPLGENYQWHFNGQSPSVRNTGPDARAFFNDSGRVIVKLTGTYSDCIQSLEKKLYINLPDDSLIVSKRNGVIIPNIRLLIVSPNPHDGEHFTIHVQLRDSMNCSLYKIDASGYISGELHLTNTASFNITAMGSLKSEVYYLKLVAGRESKVIKVVSVR